MEGVQGELSAEVGKVHKPKGDLKAANDEVNAKNEKINELRDQLEGVQWDLSAEVGKVHQLKGDLNRANNKVHTLDEQVKDLKEQLKAKLTPAENEAKYLEGRAAVLRKEIEESAKNMEDP